MTGENTEHNFLFTPRQNQNVTHGDQQGGVQSGHITGNVTQHNHFGAEETHLVVLRRTDKEVEEVKQQFVEPGEYAEAKRLLDKQGVVVLCGRGSGRSYAARRLLVDCGATVLNEMNQQRKLHSVRQNELETGHGYVWTVSELPGRPFHNSEFEQCAGTMQAAGCWLVIVLDRPGQAPSGAVAQTVSLISPDPLEVALSALNWQAPDEAEEAGVVLKSQLLTGLEQGGPPEKAARAAELALQVHRGCLEADQALLHLREDAGTAVSRWFEEGWTVWEYSMALAVAVLEHRPYDEVVSHAVKLDEMVRTAQLPEGKKLRPRRVFEKPKDQLLHDIRCTPVKRDHPRHTGLNEETVRFAREGWAAAVLLHAWSEYHFLHEILHEWLCGISGIPARRALCLIIAHVPAHEPLRLVNRLVNDRKRSHRMLATTTMEALADHHDLLPLVQETLQGWAKFGGAYAKATAAAVYSSPFGQRDLEEALRQLTRIGKSQERTPQDAVIEGVLEMLRNSDHRERIVEAVVSWSGPRYQLTGLRPVSLSLALWLLGFTLRDRPGFADFADEFGPQARTLLRRLLGDLEFALIAVDHLSLLVLRAQWSEDTARKLVRLTSLIVPDLRWPHRHRGVSDLVRTHPQRKHEIRRIFRHARRHQRRHRRAEGDPA